MSAQPEALTLPQRLREHAWAHEHVRYCDDEQMAWANDLTSAADEIERLTKLVPADPQQTALRELTMTSEELGGYEQPVAWMTHHDEPMLFLTKLEAAQYCEDDEEPIALWPLYGENYRHRK